MSDLVYLAFPPGWSFMTGSPHLALPLLRGFLASNGIQALTRDLNIEAAFEYHIGLDARSATRSCHPPTLANMNHPYFAAEDALMAVAKEYGGSWNAQLGFVYSDSPEKGSSSALAALDRSSPFDKLLEHTVQDIMRQAPRLVGLCLASVTQIVPSFQLCHRLRKAGFEGFIALGGNTVSRLSNELAVRPVFALVDGLIVFQGETPLLQLCHTLEDGTPLDKVPQLIWRDAATGIIRRNGKQPVLDLNSVPPPDFAGLPVGQYWGENYLPLVAARGCYYGQCSFCAIPFGWGESRFAGARSANVAFSDMLVLMERHGINRFKFVDEALSPQFMRSLAERIVSDNVSVEWEGYVRLESVWSDQSFVDLVARAGFRKGYFGLELVPSNTRSVLNKNDDTTPEMLLKTCNSSGIRVHFFTMLGFPGTGEQEAEETVEFILDHQDDIDTADIVPWTYAKHTHVPGVEPITTPEEDWSVEFSYRGVDDGVLGSEEVREIASRYEEIVWAEAPRLLHPTYRLVSPWHNKPYPVAAPTSRQSDATME